MTLKKPLKITLTLLLSAFTTGVSNAASDNSVITISHTYTPYLNLTGTAPGATRFYDNSELTNPGGIPESVNLGTMGLESNLGGTCDLKLSTANDFKLLHTITNNNLGNYKIQYEGLEFDETNHLGLVLQLPCTSLATPINFKLTGLISLSNIDLFLDSGIYRDVVTVTVTTQ